MPNIKHSFVSAKADGSDPTLVQPSNWNAEHVVDQYLDYPTQSAVPATPSAGTVRAFSESQAGKETLSLLDSYGSTFTIQPHLAQKEWALWKTVPAATAITTIGSTSIVATGTATGATYATTSLHTRSVRVDYLVTTPATNAVAGIRISPAGYFYRVTDGFQMIFRVAPATGVISTSRFFCGMSTSTSAPTDVDPSTLTNIAGAGYSGSDTNWQIYFSGVSGVKVDTGIAKPSVNRSGPFTVIVFSPPGGGYIGVYFLDNSSGSRYSSSTSTSENIMDQTTAAGPIGYHSVGGTSSVVGFTLFSGYMENHN